jgi:hypothetical protein
VTIWLGAGNLGQRDQPISSNGDIAGAVHVTGSGPSGSDQPPEFLQFWDKVLSQSLSPGNVTLDVLRSYCT